MTWTLGEEIEYANGLAASVVYVDGAYAVLKTMPDIRTGPGGAFIVAHISPDDPSDFVFPMEGEGEELPSLAAARVHLDRLNA